MNGNILQCYPVILHSQVISPSDVTSVSAFHVQSIRFPRSITLAGNITLGDVIAVSTVVVVRIRYNKTIIALVRG